MDAVAPHLRQYVVEQDYGAYTARDQAVWRFVLTQTHARHLHTAHPAYAQGFAAAGISVERIPDIAHMSEQLSRVGFRAVCVDGFIPPRAFQAFQARGVLPIAADMRSVEQLAYTPAPDIIHEAAGHAPFLAQPDYARYLRRIGQVGEQAFDTPHDRAVYRAIYDLSELKQSSASTPEQLRRAEQALTDLSVAPHVDSEATRLSRLYWWTVEYGLVGTPDDYRMYGAGLLSSIGEGHFCHAPEVVKRVLSAAAADVDYDITRAQPQLFVARDFSHLDEVLSEVEQQLAVRRGGHHALARARESDALASLHLSSGWSLIGRVREFDEAGVTLEGPSAVVDAQAPSPAITRSAAPYYLPLGQLDDGTPLDRVTVEQLSRLESRDGLLLRTSAGVTVRGRLAHVAAHEGYVQAALVEDCAVARGNTSYVRAATYMLLFARRVETASPLIPDAYYAATTSPLTLVPRPRTLSGREQTLNELHQRVEAALHGQLGSSASAVFERLHDQLVRQFPDEWLLRFNVLEALLRLGERDGAIATTLEGELEQLEVRFLHREPIATGLRSLRGLLSQ